MTVTVTRRDGGNDEYSRFGDVFVRNGDGTLDVVRTGSKVPHSYARGEWTDVVGDERRSRTRFWR